MHKISPYGRNDKGVVEMTMVLVPARPDWVSEKQKSRENRWVRQDPPRFSLGAKR
uniref:Uncharacterized protein n=1 Tax=Candidatus Kentrum sp. LFY TaxID=2126342 RepID=A0A450WQ55_9GAMM|nr:MAG: hypothetical protein BECKLFY1418C_GA0070996_105417 [Candidatus Kentron sp. LFY]